MRFEWDGAKNTENIRRHGISFPIAIEVFADPFSLTIEDQVVDSEQRLWTIGRLENLSVVLVVHTLRDELDDEVVRIISARKATPRERRFYEEEV